MLIALIALAAIDPPTDSYGAANTLIMGALLLVPLGLAMFRPQVGRAAYWGLAGAELAVAVLPWPGVLGRVGHDHQVALLVSALVAVAAADVAGRREELRPNEQRT